MSETKTNWFGSPAVAGVMLLLAVGVYRAPEIIKAINTPSVVVPVNPQPVATNWPAIVPEQETRMQLATYLESLAAMFPHLKDLAHYQQARKVGDVTLQQSAKLPASLAAFDAELNRRTTQAMGGTLDPGRTDLQPLANELTRIANELRT